MPISRKEVEHVALLARIALSEDELEKFTKQLGDIVAHVEKLGELDTEGTQPMTGATLLRGVMREDEARPSLPVEDAVGGAPERDGDMFKVPKVIE